jgi:nitrate/nitrite transporter NarK
LLLLVGLALLGGWLADASGPVPVLLVSGAMAAATAYPAMLLSTSDAPGAAWLGQLLLLAAGGAFAGASAGWPQAEAVPPQVRARGGTAAIGCLSCC